MEGGGKGEQAGSEGNKLGVRRASWEQGEQAHGEGSEGYLILCARVCVMVPTTSVGARGKGARGNELGVRGVSWE